MQEKLIVERICKEKICLDIGPGEGKFIMRDPYRRFGIDIDKYVCENLRIKKLNCWNGRLNEFQNTKFPLPDVIYSRNLIEHLYPKELALFLSECSGILRKKGQIVIITPVESVIWRTASHIRPYPPISIKKLLESPTESYLFSGIHRPLDLKIIRVYCTFNVFGSKILSMIIWFVYNKITTKIPSFPPIFSRHYIVVLGKI
jgi:SAM-dependent methyltransferase